MPVATETVKQLAQASALAISVLYFLGFFAANTYLYKHGFFETDFIRPRYLILGFSILICLMAFYFSTAKPIFVVRSSLTDDIKLIYSKSRSPFFQIVWSLFCFATSLTNIVFLAITGASVACLIIAQKSAPPEYWVVMFLAFFVVFTLETVKINEKFKIFFTVTERTIQIVVIYVYFKFSTWEYTSLTLLSTFAVAGFALNLSLHDRETRRVTVHKNLYDAFYALIGLGPIKSLRLLRCGDSRSPKGDRLWIRVLSG